MIPRISHAKSILPQGVRDLAQAFTKLPGIGPKTGKRLALYILQQPSSIAKRFSAHISRLHEVVQTCKRCFGLSERELCDICKDSSRQTDILCVVESALDVEAIEQAGSYTGVYHVLGGVLSPIQGIQADQLTLNELFSRVKAGKVREVIIALNHDIESEATARHIAREILSQGVTLTRLARGLPTGGDIEFADALTLTAAFEGRRKMPMVR